MLNIVVVHGDTAALHQAIRDVASGHNLPENWMNDAVKGFSDFFPPDFSHRLASVNLWLAQLRVYVLGRPEQVAMKFVALREQDLEELELVLPLMTEIERDVLVQIMYHVAAFRLDWAQKIRCFLMEQGWQID